MLRNTSNVLNAKALLYCRCSRDFQITPVHRMQNIDTGPRKTCHQAPPAPPTKETTTDRSDKAVWGSGLAALILVGYGIMCAHDSPEVRDLLTLHAPWLDEVIAILYEENTTYREFVTRLAYDVKTSMIDIKKYIDILIPESTEPRFSKGQAIADVPGKTSDS